MKYVLWAMLLVSPAFANTVNDFAFQPGSGALVPIAGILQPMDLKLSPGSTNHHSPFVPFLPFQYSLPKAYRGTGSIILTIAGVGVYTTNMPIFSGFCTSNCSSVSSFLLPRLYSNKPRNGTVTFHFNNANADRSYNFQVLQPVPEPSSLILLGTGLMSVAWKLRKQYSQLT